MQTFLGLIFCAVMVIAVVATGIWRRHVIAKTYEEFAEKEYSYTLIFEEGQTTALLFVGNAVQSFEKEDFDPKEFCVYTAKKDAPDEGTAPDSRSATAEQENLAHRQAVHAINPVAAAPCAIDGTLLDSAQEATHIALDFAPEYTKKLSDCAQNLSFTHRKFAKPAATCTEVIRRS